LKGLCELKKQYSQLPRRRWRSADEQKVASRLAEVRDKLKNSCEHIAEMAENADPAPYQMLVGYYKVARPTIDSATTNTPQKRQILGELIDNCNAKRRKGNDLMPVANRQDEAALNCIPRLPTIAEAMDENGYNSFDGSDGSIQGDPD